MAQDDKRLFSTLNNSIYIFLYIKKRDGNYGMGGSLVAAATEAVAGGSLTHPRLRHGGSRPTIRSSGTSFRFASLIPLTSIVRRRTHPAPEVNFRVFTHAVVVRVVDRRYINRHAHVCAAFRVALPVVFCLKVGTVPVEQRLQFGLERLSNLFLCLHLHHPAPNWRINPDPLKRAGYAGRYAARVAAIRKSHACFGFPVSATPAMAARPSTSCGSSTGTTAKPARPRAAISFTGQSSNGTSWLSIAHAAS